MYATVFWILPTFIGGLSVVKNFFGTPSVHQESIAENPVLAPPTLLIPFEATNSAAIDINGYAAINSRVRIYVDDEIKDTIDVKEDGSFISKNIELQLGTNNIYGKTLDSENKESLPSKTLKITYDNEKPVLEISEPEDGKLIKGGDKKVKVSGKSSTDAQVFVNGTRIVLGNEGGFTTDMSLNDGENTITIKAQDNASNNVELERKVIYEP